MNILVLAIEDGRWGAARLPGALAGAGLRVAALCGASNPLAVTRHIERRFDLPRSRSSTRIAGRIAAAIAAWQPALIVPADEQVVALLHFLVRRGPTPILDAAALSLIESSLGRPDRFDAMLLKCDTLALASRLGLRVPGGARADSLSEARNVAAAIGYPIYVKGSFAWAGRSVTRCDDPDALARTWPRPQGRVVAVKARVRAWLHRDWYPSNAPISVQAAIDGTPAMYCAVALRGRMLAGFAGTKLEIAYAGGPSTVVGLGTHDEMERAAAVMIANCGATGFINFDFMLDAAGRAWLIECNPRPGQVGHLGPRVGVDLAQALVTALRDGTGDVPPAAASREAVIALFPQEWRRDPDAAAARPEILDVPWDDPALLLRMTESAPPGAWEALEEMRPRLVADCESIPFCDSNHLPNCIGARPAFR